MSLGSGHLGSFDRRKCKGPLNGPNSTGDHCPEGWTFYQYPGPGFAGIGNNSAEASYYTWVDQHKEQRRSGFRYQYSSYQIEYSRNLVFEVGGHMEQVFRR